MDRQDNNFISAEQAAAFNKRREEKIKDIGKRVAKISEKLKDAGYKFEIKETIQEFVIAVNDGEHHVLKNDPFPLEFAEGDGKIVKRASPPIQDVIKAIIINPGGNIYETIYRSEEFKK